MLTPEDKDLLVKKGISEQQIAEQLACFEKGFPFLKRLYAQNCWIEGAVDYFYGNGNCFLEHCTFYNMRDGAIIVAPSHKVGTRWGYVLNNCIVDGNELADTESVKLGRPWHNSPIAVYLNTIFMPRSSFRRNPLHC